WNMTFSFYNSLRTIPEDMRDVAYIHKFSWWRRFTQLELPYSMIGLVWNSMMSFAGGWFFLTVTEAASIKDFQYRLPGIGSYMAVAADAGNIPAMVYGVIAMIVMIVAVDRLLWKPIVVWSDKFKFEETSGGVRPESAILNALRASHVAQRVGIWVKRTLEFIERNFTRVRPQTTFIPKQVSKRASTVITMAIIGAISIFGLLKLFGLISAVPVPEWTDLFLRAGATFLRVLAVLILSTLWTIPAGVAIGRNEKLSRILQPVVQIAASFPAPMLFPFAIFLMHFLGINFEIGAMVLMMLGTQWYILFNTIAGAMAIPSDLVEAAEIYKFGTVQKWKTLILPSLFPYLVTGWLTAAGGAWNASIVAEYENFGKTPFIAYGLGAKIWQATNDSNFAVLAASSLLLVLIVVGMNRFFWKRLYKIAETRYSLNK
ncbi:MAG TPA: ABC transporter permease subunit, partial [Candidatus Kapabacteria bacterium]|nr:ABC transporter permease subunit [Candidatus Kapabacteria bacterium]